VSDDGAPIADPIPYYDELGTDEWERLETGLHGELEFENTVAYLTEWLPDGGHVLDAGGGAGRYADWLLRRGYEVTLLDASKGQLDVAREKLPPDAGDEAVRIVRGSIDALPLPADRFDATLCLGGPLSHLVDGERRARAASELRHVTRPGTPVFASVMGRLHVLLVLLHRAEKLDVLPELARTGDYDRDLLDRHDLESAFVSTHFFRRDELQALLADAGFEVVRTAGLEGIAGLAAESGALDGLDRAERAAVTETVDRLREDESVVDLSPHLLAVCRA